MPTIHLLIQFLKRLIIGIMFFLIIIFLVALAEYRMGIYSIFALALLIAYPILVDITLDKFFIDKLQKYKFLFNSHLIIWAINMVSYTGLVSTGKQFPWKILPFYSFILIIVFSIKKRRFLKKG